MLIAAAWLLIAGGICACSPLFKRVSNALGRFVSTVGFPIGIVVLILAADVGLGLNFLSSIFGLTTPPSPTVHPWLKYYFPVTIILGILLISRPIRNVRWASVISLGIGLLASAYLRIYFTGVSTTILGIVFVIVALAIYMVLRFVEDIFEFIGRILAFPPIATGIGLVSVYFGIITMAPAV